MHESHYLCILTYTMTLYNIYACNIQRTGESIKASVLYKIVSLSFTFYLWNKKIIYNEKNRGAMNLFKVKSQVNSPYYLSIYSLTIYLSIPPPSIYLFPHHLSIYLPITYCLHSLTYSQIIWKYLFFSSLSFYLPLFNLSFSLCQSAL